jgi:hypothetical protein
LDLTPRLRLRLGLRLRLHLRLRLRLLPLRYFPRLLLPNIFQRTLWSRVCIVLSGIGHNLTSCLSLHQIQGDNDTIRALKKP